MINLRVDFADLDVLVRSYAHAPEMTADELEVLAYEATRELEAAVAEETPHAHGTLRASYISHVQRLTDGIGVEGITGTSLNYAPWVELGTRPHMPPLAPLIDWVKAKGLDIGLIGKSKRARKSRDDVAERIARAIQWKIYHRGTEGAHMFEKGFNAVRPSIEARASDTMRRIAQRIAGGRA